MVKLISLVITRSNETNNLHFSYLASVDVFDGLNNISGDVSGLIDNRHESYITLTWNNPRSTKVGMYSCEANGENLHGQTVTITKTVDVKATKPDVENLLDVIQQQTYFLETQSLQLTKLQEDLRLIGLSVNERCLCCERFNKSLKSFYHISESHNGSRYYLSPASRIVLIKEAESQCELLGGYLTEIDSEGEYLFIKNFLKTTTGYAGVYTGGNDEAFENNWVNTYSKTPVKYIKWGPQQPSDGRSSNCLSLWSDFDWTATDLKCYQGVVPNNRGYLCEVPEM